MSLIPVPNDVAPGTEFTASLWNQLLACLRKCRPNSSADHLVEVGMDGFTIKQGYKATGGAQIIVAKIVSNDGGSAGPPTTFTYTVRDYTRGSDSSCDLTTVIVNPVLRAAAIKYVAFSTDDIVLLNLAVISAGAVVPQIETPEKPTTGACP